MSKQIKTFIREPKWGGLGIESRAQFDDRINRFCNGYNVLSIIPVRTNSNLLVMVIYETEG